MKYKNCLNLLLLIVILSGNYSINYACTGFAVYSNNKVYYGLNLDWQNTEYKFSIRRFEGFKGFHLEFLSSGSWLTSSGMNEAGLLTTCQMVYPGVNATLLPNQIQTDYGNLYRMSTDFFTRADTVADFLKYTNRRLVQVPLISLHSLVASVNGSAIVAESGADSNMITYAENNFLVMTNFNNHKFWGKPYNQVTGVGSDRYKTAYQYISANINTFSMNDAWEVLKQVRQTGGSYPTICSMVFDPLEKNVYVVMNCNFNKIYRISISENFIETFSGFPSYKKINLGSEGITSSALNTLTAVENSIQLISESYSLEQNYPNPFNPFTVFTYIIPERSNVKLEFFSLNGERIAELVNEVKEAGTYNYKLNSADYQLSSGVYICRLSTGAFSKSIKISFVK